MSAANDMADPIIGYKQCQSFKVLPGTDVKEDSREAFCIGLLGGVVYAKALVFALGIWMALPTVNLWLRVEALSSRVILYLDGILISMLCFVIFVLPLAYALRFLFPGSAKLAGLAVALGAFLIIYVPDPVSLWYLFRSHPALMIGQHLVFFGGPVLALWAIDRLHNKRLVSRLR